MIVIRLRSDINGEWFSLNHSMIPLFEVSLTGGSYSAGNGRAAVLQDVDTHVALTDGFYAQRTVGNGLLSTADSVNIGAVGDILEGSAVGDGYTGEGVDILAVVVAGITSDVRHVTADIVAVGSVLTHLQSGYSATDRVELLEMLRQRAVQGRRHLTGRIVILREAGGVDGALEIITKVRTAGVRQRDVGAFVDAAALLELYLTAVIQTRNTAEGEHQVEVLCPCLGTAGKALGLVLVGRIVVRFHIGDVPGSVVVVLILTECRAERAGSGVELPVHGEVDDAHAGALGIVGSTVVDAVEERVLRGRLTGGADVVLAVGDGVLKILLDGSGIGAVGELREVGSGIIPGVELDGFSGVVTVPCLAEAAANLTEHIEVVVACRLRRGVDLIVIPLVQRESGDVADGVDTESVNAHVDVVRVRVYGVIRNRLVLGVQVNAVARDLAELTGPVIPVQAGKMTVVVVVVGVTDLVIRDHVGKALGLLHQLQTGIVLLLGLEVVILLSGLDIVIVEQFLRRNHAGLDVGQIGVVVLGEERSHVSLTEVRGVVPYDVLYDLHALFMSGGDQILIGEIVALVSGVDLREVERVIAMIVIAGRVLDNGRDPYRGEAQRLDVVELIGKTLEVAAPCGVGIGVVRLLVIPAVNIVAGIAVIETGGDDKVDGILTHINRSIIIRNIRILLAETSVSVPPLTGRAGELLADLTGELGCTVGQLEVDFGCILESIGVPCGAGLGRIPVHLDTGISAFLVGRKRIPVIDVGNLIGAVYMDDDAVGAGICNIGLNRNIGDLFICRLCRDNSSRNDQRKAQEQCQNT